MLDVEIKLKTSIQQALKEAGADIELDKIIIERSKDKQKTQIINLIVSAGELYVDKHKNTVTPPITLNQLIEDGLITKEEMKDPFNEKRTLCGYLGYDGNKVSWNDTTDADEYCLSIE